MSMRRYVSANPLVLRDEAAESYCTCLELGLTNSSGLEQRYFLAEILKNSNLPSTTLLQIIRDTGVEPAWTQIALPTGMYGSSVRDIFAASSRLPDQAIVSRISPPAFIANVNLNRSIGCSLPECL